MADLPVDRARSLRAAILEARDEIEAQRRVPTALVASLVEAELFRLFVPRDVGGLETEPLEAYRAYEELARADASVAWVTWNGGLPAVLSRCLDAETRAEIFGDPGTFCANSTRPTGRAVATDGGIRLSGRWSLVSGCELASWIPLMAPVWDGDTPRRLPGGAPDLRMFFVPKGDYEILDTWHTGGLRGSGSHDVVAEDVFVPERRGCHALGPPQLEGALFRFPFAPILAPGCASICLGIARAALDALIEFAGDARSADFGGLLRDKAPVQEAVARAQTLIEAARGFLHDAVRATWAQCEAGQIPDPATRGRLWRAALHAARSAKDALQVVFDAGGTESLYSRTAIERCQRDLWTVGQHVIIQPRWFETAGRVELGLPADEAMF